MTGLDTNVLVRYIVQDDVSQARMATKHIEKNCTSDSPGRVNVIVLCELIWVMSRGYKYDRQILVNVVRRILSSPELLVEEDEAVWLALRAYEKSNVDFSDCLLGILNQRAGAAPTMTFDKKAATEPFFKLLA